MSLKNWLKKIWKAIQSLFNSIPADLKSAINIGVTITENIKKFIDSPVADILTVIIPGDIDDKIKAILRAKVPQILLQLKLANECADSSNPEQITACAIKNLQALTGNLKSAYLHNLSVLIAQFAADGKLTWEDGAYIMEWYYQHHFKTNRQS
ncbi:hypothetical protein [Mucilaginibacter terrae]|uniref:Uncharacterized protein n=1 Tax=Mucilaginibacter terrae TaxID=1955052 RepID=A0ABU3GZ97_9SPHI|nr:hypothetical protein [Mucilaginibacter terrae]MDT3405091.1 hypothetical protein [Mucilaginibacter terrae]